jgi:hypothetical protein
MDKQKYYYFLFQYVILLQMIFPNNKLRFADICCFFCYSGPTVYFKAGLTDILILYPLIVVLWLTLKKSLRFFKGP